MSNDKTHEIVLTGLDGSNPLAFLAALGTLRAMSDASPKRCIKLGWVLHTGSLRPFIQCDPLPNENELAQCVGTALKIGFSVDEQAEIKRERAVKRFDKAKKAVKDKRDKIKKRPLNRDERTKAEQEELQPLNGRLEKSRWLWLRRLSATVSSPELAIGKDLSATRTEFSDTAKQIIERATQKDRTAADLMASFGSDGCFDAKTERIDATPFCFITGSGHQYFLDTVRQLISKVDVPRIRRMLFQPWIHEDEQLSMRWDPVEDRRYATMWDDPGGGKDKARTNWAANLLAYHGLSMFPSVPTSGGLKTAAFVSYTNLRAFSWPVWCYPLNCDVVRSLLTLKGIVEEPPEYLRAMGVAEVYRAQRIQVGTPPLHKINFTPAEPV